MRACAEVSVWTKFCEIDFPNLMAKCTAQDTELSQLPIEILKLENHLRQPPVIQNVGKRKKEILVNQLKSLGLQVSKRNIQKLTEDMKKMQVFYCYVGIFLMKNIFLYTKLITIWLFDT